MEDLSLNLSPIISVVLVPLSRNVLNNVTRQNIYRWMYIEQKNIPQTSVPYPIKRAPVPLHNATVKHGLKISCITTRYEQAFGTRIDSGAPRASCQLSAVFQQWAVIEDMWALSSYPEFTNQYQNYLESVGCLDITTSYPCPLCSCSSL